MFSEVCITPQCFNSATAPSSTLALATARAGNSKQAARSDEPTANCCGSLEKKCASSDCRGRKMIVVDALELSNSVEHRHSIISIQQSVELVEQRDETSEYCKTVKADHFNINKATDSFNQSILRAASETIPRGVRKNYRPHWTEELQGLEDEVARTREKVENNPTPQNNIAHKACTAKYRKAYTQAARTCWREKTEKLNLDRDGNKLWKLTKTMNDEDTKSSPVMIQRDQETVTAKSAANCFRDSYEQVSNIMIPNNR